MKNRKFKILFAFVIMFVNLFLVNIDGVKADCSCYYMGGNSYTNAGAIETATYFWVEFYYSSNQATVKHSCYQDMQYNLPNNSSFVISSKAVGCTGKAFDRGTPFNVDSGAIARNNCSKDACDSAKIYVKEEPNYKKSIITGSGDYKLNAVDKDFYDERQKQQEEDEANADNTVDDISVDDIKANEEGIKNADVGSSNTCDLIPDSIIDFLNNLFLIIQVIGIVLLIAMSMIEFIKAITASSEDGLKGAFKNTYRRIIIAVALLILPMFIIWILNVVNANAYETDEYGERIIGQDGNPLCK